VNCESPARVAAEESGLVGFRNHLVKRTAKQIARDVNIRVTARGKKKQPIPN
jgi:hypothetical protein